MKDKKTDTLVCVRCGGKTALVQGIFSYTANQEPFEDGVEEELDVEGECRIYGFLCIECNHVQGLWHE